MTVSRTMSIIGLISLPHMLIAGIHTNILFSLPTPPESTKQQPTAPLYACLLEQLFESTPQSAPHSEAESPLEPWILQLFGQQLQPPKPSSFDELDATTQKKQAILSILSLSLQEYRKNTKKELN